MHSETTSVSIFNTPHGRLGEGVCPPLPVMRPPPEIVLERAPVAGECLLLHVVEEFPLAGVAALLPRLLRGVDLVPRLEPLALPGPTSCA